MFGMSECLFCQIGRKVKDAYIVWEDDTHLAFLDVYPKSPGHTLVIPKKHSTTFMDMAEEEFIQLMKVARTIAQRMYDVCECERIFVRLIGLHIPHTHVHLEASSFPVSDKYDFKGIQEILAETDG
jgi:histidine triad (HIT) family protein